MDLCNFIRVACWCACLCRDMLARMRAPMTHPGSQAVVVRGSSARACAREYMLGCAAARFLPALLSHAGVAARAAATGSGSKASRVGVRAAPQQRARARNVHFKKLRNV